MFFGCGNSPTLLNVAGKKKVVNDITELIQDSGLQTNIGMKAVNINSGETLYEWNSQALFNPASNNKLYTCVATITLLDSTFAFNTRVYLDSSSIYLVGGGDPDLRIEHLEEMAQVTSDSIKLFLGRDYYFVNNRKYMRTVDLRKTIDYLILDDSIVDDIPFGQGWMWDEGHWWYAAPIGGLSVNDNCIDFYVKPGKLGNACQIDYYPKTSYITFENNSTTVNDTIDFQKLKIDRNWISKKNNFTITGELMDTTAIDTLYRNIYDPSLFTATIFKELLVKNGIKVRHLSKEPQDLTIYENLATHLSDPLIVSAKNLMNESDNLTAELFVKSMGAMDTLPGTWNAGIDSIKSFLSSEVKIDTSQIKLADGSGVSRYTLTSSDQLISLLTWVYNSEYKDDFISTLPGGGWPKSTLEKRLIDEGGKVRAKTGGLSGVTNLAGYIESPKHGRVVFSILMNGYVGSSSKYRHVQNQIVKTIIYD